MNQKKYIFVPNGVNIAENIWKYNKVLMIFFVLSAFAGGVARLDWVINPFLVNVNRLSDTILIHFICKVHFAHHNFTDIYNCIFGAKLFDYIKGLFVMPNILCEM